MNTTTSTDLIEQKVATIMEHVDNYQKQTIVFEFKPEDLTSSEVIEAALYFVRSKLKKVIQQRETYRKNISNQFRNALLEEEQHRNSSTVKNKRRARRDIQEVLADLAR